MDRTEHLRKIIDSMIDAIQDTEARRCAYVHLYGVAQFCALLARKRGISAELAVAASMLHDISAYVDCPGEDHAARSAAYARNLLKNCGLYTIGEIELICTAIANHSDKAQQQDPLSEILKDGDVLQHAFYSPSGEIKPSEKERFYRLATELM